MGENKLDFPPRVPDNGGKRISKILFSPHNGGETTPVLTLATQHEPLRLIVLHRGPGCELSRCSRSHCVYNFIKIYTSKSRLTETANMVSQCYINHFNHRAGGTNYLRVLVIQAPAQALIEIILNRSRALLI